jgi:hypothetical protein
VAGNGGVGGFIEDKVDVNGCHSSFWAKVIEAIRYSGVGRSWFLGSKSPRRLAGAFFQSFLAFFWTIALFQRTFAFAFEKVGIFLSFSYSLSTSYYHISQ